MTTDELKPFKIEIEVMGHCEDDAIEQVEEAGMELPITFVRMIK